MSVEGRELGWDDSIKQDSQNFDPIPEGDYNVTIEKYDRSTPASPALSRSR